MYKIVYVFCFGLRFDNLKLTDCSFEGVDFTNLKIRRCTFVCFSFLNCNFNNCKFDSQKYIRTLDDIYFLKCFFEYKTDSKNLIEILNYYTVKMNDGLKVFIKLDN